MNDRNQSIVGAVIGFLILAGIGYGVYRGIRALFPPTGPIMISLNAYFDGDKLVIGGQSSPPAKGRVRVTVTTLIKGDSGFEQSAFADLDAAGSFRVSTAEMPALGELQRGDPMKITGEVWVSGRTEPATSGTIYLNANAPAKPPVQLQTAVIIVSAVSAVCLFLFFFAFTGPPSLTKDRVAIILSYFVILLFLILPLGAPVMLPPIWGSGVMDTAVGFIITRIPQQNVAEKAEPEWALNIGGYVTENAPTPPPNAPAPTTSPAPEPAANPVPAATPNAPKAGASEPAPESDTAQAAVNLIPGAHFKEVTVRGGLVIPLYVIILSVIGGAINMTRQVPGIQGAAPGEYSSFFRRVVQKFTRADTETTTVQEQQVTRVPAVEASAPADSSQPSNVPATTADDGKRTSADQDYRRTQQWRLKLLNLYMYLISAPFLAIVTYYLLWWLDLTKLPIVVLVSFSIGLLSDQVVDKILGVVKTALGESTSEANGGHPAEDPKASEP